MDGPVAMFLFGLGILCGIVLAFSCGPVLGRAHRMADALIDQSRQEIIDDLLRVNDGAATKDQ
jgi:hypothetical protein